MQQEISGTESLINSEIRSGNVQQFLQAFPHWERQYNLAYLQEAEKRSRDMVYTATCPEQAKLALVATMKFNSEIMRSYKVRGQYFKMAVDVMEYYRESKSPELLHTAEALVRKLISLMPR